MTDPVADPVSKADRAPDPKPRVPRPRAARTPRIEIDWTATLGFRIDRSVETASPRELAALKALLYQLRANGQVDVLRAFARGDLPVAVLKQAKRAGRLGSDTLLADLAMFRRLWHDDAHCPQRRDAGAAHTDACLGAVDVVLPRMGTGATQARYAKSLRKLRRVATTALPADALVSDLARVDWPALQARWMGGGTVGSSGSDWNHLRRAVSRFLSTLLGHPHHATRLAIMAQLPVAAEEERVPELTVDEFWALVAAVPAHARPCYVVLAVTMMRLGEYLRCTEAHLVPAKHAVRVPGTKSTRSKRVVEVGPAAWPWVEAGIPSPLQSRWMHLYFWRACVALGHGRYEPVLDAAGEPVLKTVVERGPDGQPRRTQVPRVRYTGLRLHDLRHVGAQVATDEGTTGAQLMDALGHSDPKITARYARRRHAAVAGRTLTDALFEGRTDGV